MTKASRVNARLPPDLAQKTAYLERRLRLSTTEVIHRAIERYYAEVTDEPQRAAEVLERAGFVACADGPAELSQTYKAELEHSLRGKT